MDFVTNILIFGAAFFAVLVSGDDSNFPLLGAKAVLVSGNDSNLPLLGAKAVLVSGDNSSLPLLGAKGMVGVRNCGSKNELIKITSLTHSKCDTVPCALSHKDVLTISVEFVPLENVASLSTEVTSECKGIKATFVNQDTCKGLVVGKCPFIKGETYVQAIPIDITKLITSDLKTTVEAIGNISANTEIIISNPDKTSSVCASFAAHVV